MIRRIYTAPSKKLLMLKVIFSDTLNIRLLIIKSHHKITAVMSEWLKRNVTYVFVIVMI